MVNVLIVNWSGQYGGVEKHLLMLAEGLRDRNYRFVFATPDTGPFPSMLRERNLAWHPVPMRRTFDVTSIRRLAALVRTEAIDLIHAQQSRGLYLAGIASRLAGAVPVVQTEHNSSIDWWRRASIPRHVRWGTHWLRYAFVHWVANRIVALSSGVARFYTEVLHTPPEKIAIIPHAHPVAAQRRHSAHATPMIGTVANLTEQKGLPYLIEAAYLVCQRHPHVRFQIIGGGHLQDVLSAQIARLDLRDQVVLQGFQPNATALMAGFDLFVLPSLWEPFGLVLLEAMAQGLPVVATRVDGVPDVVLHGKTGLLAPPANAEKLAEQILYLLENEDIAVQMGERGRQRCAEEFSVAKMLDRFDHLYMSVLRHAGTLPQR